MKKICILDRATLGDTDLSEFERLGEVTSYETTEYDEVQDRILDFEIVLVNKVFLNEGNIKYAKKLELICVMATGTNNIDLEYARSRGIGVTNVAGYSTGSVVQHTFALALSLVEKMAYYNEYTKSGEYSRSTVFTNLTRPFHELQGKNWGIIGLGAIGRGVADIAKAFGCHVSYYSTSGKNQNAEYPQKTLHELLTQSDILSIHAPLNEQTKGLIHYGNLCLMKKESILINVGRGPIVVEQDLCRALDEERIGGAGLDVLCMEPMEAQNPLLMVKDPERLLITPHIAWASIEARERLVHEVAQNIRAFVAGESRNRCC